MSNPLWAALLAADVPVTISSGDARDAAGRELTDPAYQASQPSVFLRVLRWLGDRIGDLLGVASRVVPGGPAGLVVLALLAVLVVVAVRLRVGRVRRGHRSTSTPFDDRPRSASEYRVAAEQAFARGDLDEAVRDRFRAMVRGLEQRGVLQERVGRTVDEAAEEAGTRLPGQTAALRRAARIFDDTFYGGRPATEADYQNLVGIEATLADQRPSPVGTPR
jgi:hypothetical protein